MDNPEEDGDEDIITATIYDELMGKSVEEILRDGQKALFANLVARVRSNKASHQEKAILRNILKDNGLVLGVPPEQATANRARPPVDLPEFGPPEYEN